MRKLIYAINITLDGCCDHTKMRPDEETYEYFIQLTRDAGALVYGRKTYELMVPYWPDIARDRSGGKQENDFADAFVAVGQMIVFSRSLEKAEGKNTSIVRGDLGETILKLKQQPGKNIMVGGVSIAIQLAELGLIDEFHFMVHPTIAGEGRRLLEGINPHQGLNLKLVSSKVFRSGCVALHYKRG